MKLIRKTKLLIPLISILMLVSVSCSSNQPASSPSNSETTNNEQNLSEIVIRDPDAYSLYEGRKITTNGKDRIVPVITGQVLWWIVLTILVGTLIAISVIIIASVVSSAFSAHQQREGGKNPYLSEALPTLIEGITIVYIVLAVLLLSIIGITSAEGTLSILAGISGYVLGKQRGPKQKGKESLTTDEEQ